MALDDLPAAPKAEPIKGRERWIGVYIGVLAVILAICALGGGNATKDATLRNIEATNNWSFFQAKNLRRHMLRIEADQLEIMQAAQPTMPDAAKQAIAAKIKQIREQEAKLTSDPQSGEGLDELFKKGKELEVQRDLALKRDPNFDYGAALLQIAIVIASVALIAGGWLLLSVSAVLAVLGTLFTFNGFALAVQLPFG